MKGSEFIQKDNLRDDFNFIKTVFILGTQGHVISVKIYKFGFYCSFKFFAYRSIGGSI